MIAFDYLRERGLTAARDGDRLIVSPSAELTDDDRQFIRRHKAEILAELDRRRRRDDVLLQLADNPGVKYAFTVDTGGDPAIIAVAIRDLATFEMSIAKDRFDPFRIIELFEDSA